MKIEITITDDASLKQISELMDGISHIIYNVDNKSIIKDVIIYNMRYR